MWGKKINSFPSPFFIEVFLFVYVLGFIGCSMVNKYHQFVQIQGIQRQELPVRISRSWHR